MKKNMNLNKIANSIINKWNKEISQSNLRPQHFICEGSGAVVLSDNDKQLAVDLGANESDFPTLHLLLSNRVKRGMK